MSKKKRPLVIEKLSKFYLNLGGFVMGMIAVIVMVTVILRYFFSISFIWVEEFVTYAFIFSTFLGLGICIIKNEHIAVDYLFDKLTGKKKLFVSMFNNIVVMIVLSVILANSFNWIDAVGNQISDGLRVQMGHVYIIMPASMVLALICSVIRMVLDYKEYSNFKELEEE